MAYAESVLGAIGRTPLVRLRRVAAGLRATLLAKLENLNPGGSLKDRIALAMVEDAERRGLLKPGGTIIEPTSGNTGISLAIVAAVKGYRCIFTVPDKASREKVTLLRAFGARVVVCPSGVPREDPESYYSVAERLQRETPGSFVPYQYFNPLNPQAHYRTTGPEIWEQTEGKVTHFVCGIGTGGTISGVGRYLKERNPAVRVIGVDPAGSVLADAFRGGPKGPPRPWRVEGIGCTYVPGTFQREWVDEVLRVDDGEAFHHARRLLREEGIIAGGSSGAALAAALRVAEGLSSEATVVVLLADGGERYLGKLYAGEGAGEEGGTLGAP